jgi:hypothetical protein
MRKSQRWNVMKSATAAAVLGLSSWTAAWANAPAVFNMATMTLSLPDVRINANTKIKDVVVKFYELGHLELNDANVGPFIQYFLEDNVLQIPTVSVDGTTLQGVSLTGSMFLIESFGAIETVTDEAANHTLTVSVAEQSGAPLFSLDPAQSAQKPGSRLEFFNFMNTAAQNQLKSAITPDTNAVLTMTDVTFDGNDGKVFFTLNAAGVVTSLVATFSFR